VSDEIVKLPRDKDGTILRLVCFTCGGHQFRLITNRFDLHTHDIVRLYAWRWQVELLFRAWKHTLSGLHLLNLSEAGIAIQFQILLLGALLWTLTQQVAEIWLRLRKEKNSDAAQHHRQFGSLFQRAWRLRRQPLRLCANCLARPLSHYLKERVALAA
jgi:IS4 transposase